MSDTPEELAARIAAVKAKRGKKPAKAPDIAPAVAAEDDKTQAQDGAGRSESGKSTKRLRLLRPSTWFD